jgi:predicted methyltransferase
MKLDTGLFLALAGTILMCGATTAAQPDGEAAFQQRLRAAMQGSIRTDEEKARDANRLPVEILTFFRMRDDLRVIEVLPAGGWFTKLLAPALAERGKLYVTHPPGFYADAYQRVAGLPGLEKVEQIGWGGTGAGSGGPFGPSGRWEVEPVDRVLTFRNYHNFSPADRDTVNRSAFDALKPGGYYGIVDHTRRHNEPDNPGNRRRVDPVLVIKEVQAAGFEFVDFSDLYYRPGDALELEVANPAVNDRTDRIALLFRKPQ